MQPIAFFITFFLLLASGFRVNGNYWSWKCIDEKCIRNDTPSEHDNVDVAELLDVCRITCGRYGAIWPQPSGEINLSSQFLPVDPYRVTFDMKMAEKDGPAKQLLDQMTQQFVQDMKSLCVDGTCRLETQKVVLAITINANSTESNLTWDTDESYVLRVRTSDNDSKIEVLIEAVSVFGARHALETLFQLATSVPASKNNTTFLVMVKDAFVRDRPVYPHRGLLIDTSRHYLSVNTMMRTLDAMGHSKLNVLHWHATDTHSFPLQLPRVPQLAKWGAYSANKVYTDRDIANIINHGRKRGVRVIVEIDSPAHAGNGWQWGPSAGLGDLALCVNQLPWQFHCYEPPCGQLNPANPNVYKILELLYRDLVEVLPKGTDLFHMGGDEVVLSCWNSSVEVVEYMRKQGWGRTEADFFQLWAEFYEKSLQILDNIVGHSKSRVILWSNGLTKPEIIEKYLSKERFVIHTWVSASENFLITGLLEKDYKVIISTESAWNLDHGVSSGWSDSKLYHWATAYNNRIPLPTNGVYGGEAPVWGEYIDEQTLDGVIWPRAAAVAERLWTNPDSDNLAAQYRFLHHRERLVKMGVRAEAIIPEWCYLNEAQCAGL